MLRLVQTDWGCFDLALSDPDDDAVATVVYALLLTDAEAPPRREPDGYLRRGWWADPTAGTGLWHVRRQALNAAARREALAMVERALADRAPGLTGIAVREVITAREGSVSRVQIEVSGAHNGRQFVVQIPL